MKWKWLSLQEVFKLYRKPQRIGLGGGAQKRSSDKAFVIYLYKTGR